MRKSNDIKKPLILAFLSVFVVSSLVAFYTMTPPESKELAVGGGPGTINQLSPWHTADGAVQLASSTADLLIPSLANCDTIDTDGDGRFECGTDGGGGGSATTTWGSIIGTLADQTDLQDELDTIPLSASTTEWHNFHTTPSGRITAGTGIDWTGNTLDVTVVDTNTTYTAGDALTLTGTDFDFDGGATPSGDLGGTWASPSVDDDSHAHTGTTLSGIDISSDTNLSGDTEIVLTGDALSIASNIARDTELHSAVTLAGTLDYITLSGQQITRNAIDLVADVTGILPVSNGGLGTSTAPSLGQVLLGNGSGGYNLVATSSLGISGGGGSSDTNWSFLSATSEVATATSTAGVRAAFVTATSTTATSTFSGPVQIGATAGNNLFKITANTDYSASNSVGGMMNVNCTNNTGSCFVAYTNAASSNGNLFGIRVDNTGFAHSALRLDYDGSGDAFTAVGTASTSNAISASNTGVDHTITSAYTGSTPDKGPLNLTSTNSLGSVFQVTGNPLALGVGKITHNDTGDADSSILSLAASDTGYLGQGIFLNMETVASTTQKILNLRADSSEKLTLLADGRFGIGDSSPSSLLTVGADAFQVNSSGQVVAGTWAASDIDISDYTNLAGDTEIVLTGDALSIASTIARDSELPDALSDLSFDVGSVDTTEFGYLDGVTSAIQTQLSGKFGTAGRSLTSSGVTVDADAELYTDTKCIYFEDPAADDDFKSIWANKSAGNYTITEIWGESDQTVAFDLQIDDGTPADVNGTDISPAAGEAEDTSLSGDTTLAADEELDLAITSVTNTPTWLSVCWTYTKND